MDQIIKFNVKQLDYLTVILRQIGEEEFSKPIDQGFDFTIGQQFRHILDHYIIFLKQYRSGVIDYSLREREESLETNLSFSIERLLSVIQQVEDLISADDLDLKVNTEDWKDQVDEFANSSVKRELSFLATHTIHHLAILKIMLNFLGKEKLNSEIGVSPATLRYYSTINS